jgi:hypothetical protein
MKPTTTIKREIRAIKKAEDNTLRHYKALLLASMAARETDIKEIQQWIKSEYPSSWGRKLAAFISGGYKYRGNIPVAEVDKISTLTGLLQLVRMAKKGPVTAADAEARERSQRSGSGKNSSEAPKNSSEENIPETPEAPERSQKIDPLAAYLAAEIAKISGTKKQLADAVYQLAGSISEKVEREANISKIKMVMALLQRAEEVLEA